jgi:tetratricopeptide (TPR) repeat protein
VEITPFAKQQVPTLYAVIQALNLAEAAGPSPELARAYAAACRMAGLVPLHGLAEAYARRAQNIAERIEQLPILANVLRATGLHYVRVGQWERAQDIGEQAVEAADWLGDRRLRATVMMILANVAYYRGAFDRCAELWADIYAAASQRGDTQQQGWALAWQAVNLLRLGQMGHVDQAVASLERSIALLSADIAYSGLMSYGMLAVARLRQGQLQLARQIADRTAHLITRSRPTAAHVFEGYAGMAEVYLALWEASTIGNHMPPERKTLLRSARQACQALHRFARVFPIGQPRTWLCQGLYEWLAGKPDRAHKAWQKSLTAAERLAMPYEQGRAHYEIGRHLPPDDPGRQEHLIHAREIFTQLEAVYELAREEMAHNGQLLLGNDQTLVKKY